jgi:hypothetical protein
VRWLSASPSPFAGAAALICTEPLRCLVMRRNLSVVELISIFAFHFAFDTAQKTRKQQRG